MERLADEEKQIFTESRGSGRRAPRKIRAQASSPKIQEEGSADRYWSTAKLANAVGHAPLESMVRHKITTASSRQVVLALWPAATRAARAAIVPREGGYRGHVRRMTTDARGHVLEEGRFHVEDADRRAIPLRGPLPSASGSWGCACSTVLHALCHERLGGVDRNRPQLLICTVFVAIAASVQRTRHIHVDFMYPAPAKLGARCPRSSCRADRVCAGCVYGADDASERPRR